MLVKVLLILIRVCHSPHFFHIFFNDLYHFVRISALAHPVPHRSTADSFLPALTVRCPHTSRSHCVPRSLCVGVAGRLVSICFPFKHTHVACGQSRSRTRIVCYTQIRKQFASLFFSQPSLQTWPRQNGSSLGFVSPNDHRMRWAVVMG